MSQSDPPFRAARMAAPPLSIPIPIPPSAGADIVDIRLPATPANTRHTPAPLPRPGVFTVGQPAPGLRARLRRLLGLAS